MDKTKNEGIMVDIIIFAIVLLGVGAACISRAYTGINVNEVLPAMFALVAGMLFQMAMFAFVRCKEIYKHITLGVGVFGENLLAYGLINERLYSFVSFVQRSGYDIKVFDVWTKLELFILEVILFYIVIFVNKWAFDMGGENIIIPNSWNKKIGIILTVIGYVFLIVRYNSTLYLVLCAISYPLTYFILTYEQQLWKKCGLEDNEGVKSITTRIIDSIADALCKTSDEDEDEEEYDEEYDEDVEIQYINVFKRMSSGVGAEKMGRAVSYNLDEDFNFDKVFDFQNIIDSYSEVCCEERKVIDTHAHLNHPVLYKLGNDFIDGLYRSGIKTMLVPGLSFESNVNAKRLSEQYSYIYYAAGVHPKYVYNVEWTRENWEWLEKVIAGQKCVAVGEIGLDYSYEGFCPEHRNRQIAILTYFIELANKYNKPVILHAKSSDKKEFNAYEDLISVLSEHKANAGGVIHSFDGTIEDSNRFIKCGINYFGIGGRAVFDPEFEETIKMLPDESILLESDAPFTRICRPTTNPNTPMCLFEVAGEVAMIKGKDLEDIIEKSNHSAKILFECRD